MQFKLIFFYFFGWSIHCWKWDINYYYCIYVYFSFQIGYICLLYLGALTFGICNYIFLMNQPLCPFIMTFFVSLQFLNFLSLSTSLGHLCKATLQASSRRQWSHKIELESLSHYSEERPNNTENSFWTLWYLEINVNFLWTMFIIAVSVALTNASVFSILLAREIGLGIDTEVRHRLNHESYVSWPQ